MLYVCQFNVLGVHASMRDPTRAHLKFVLHTAVGASTALYLVFGVAGYVLAGSRTPGDIITALPARDPLAVLGRIAFLGTLSAACPMLVVPCRETLWALRIVVGAQLSAARDADTAAGSDAAASGAERGAAAAHPAFGRAASLMLPSRVVAPPAAALRRAQSTPLASAEPEPMPHGVLIALTVAIVAGVYVCALVVPAVEKVWALCGSSVCIAVAFILPTSYYLEVRVAKYAPLRKGAARVVLVAAVAMALVCTGIQVL